jgi:glycosyltransferase involved in cell wall biosynthesis
MRIIALMPVRNESWIIESTLNVLSAFCDYIIVADQRSADGTSAILSKFAPKVLVIDNPDTVHSTRIRWRLLDAARSIEGTNFIFLFDADEIPTANIKNPEVLNYVTSLAPGTALELPWIQLWRSPLLWRNDQSIWSNRSILCGFRDDRNVKYGPISEANDHNLRIPVCDTIINIDLVKVLHYQWILPERKRSKEAWYRASELVAFVKDAQEINYYYRVTRDERKVSLSPIDPEWVAGWQELGIDLEHFKEEPLYWYDVEVLRWFKEKGPAYFAPLDLWDVDWEQKRQLALAQGYENIPDHPIHDPRTREQKLYHTYLAKFQCDPFWRNPKDLIRLADQGMRNLAKRLGLRREYLEYLGLLTRKQI